MGTRRRAYVPHYVAGDGAHRHVWITGGQDGRLRDPWPGLLVEWARREDGWWGRIVFVPHPAQPGELREGWISADHIRPAPEP